MQQPPSTMSPTAISGIPATSCSARRPSSTSIATFEPDTVSAVAAAVAIGRHRPRLRHARSRRVRARDREIGRLRRHGEDQARRGPAGVASAGPMSARGMRSGSSRRTTPPATRAGRRVFVDARARYVSSDKALVALLGVEDLVVIASEDAVLVAHRDRAADHEAAGAAAEAGGADGAPRSTSRCTGPGALTSRSTTATAIRSSASW